MKKYIFRFIIFLVIIWLMLLVWQSYLESRVVDTDAKITSIFIDKSERKMVLFDGRLPVKIYSISLGFAPVGQKMQEGDGKTPTGEYVIDWRNENSSFYKSLHISYPSREQKRIARAEGRNPGGMIMIHGQPNGSRFTGDDAIKEDWTNGCVSVSNNEMDELWRLVRDGTEIHIQE